MTRSFGKVSTAVKIARRLRYLAAGSAVTLALAGPFAGAAIAAEGPAPLYNSAQANFLSGNDPAGLADLRALLDGTPDDSQALALQAIWSDYSGDLITREAALNRLGAVDGAMAQGTRNLLGAIGAAVGTLPNPCPR